MKREKLTKEQASFLRRHRITDQDRPFILCVTGGDDRIAKNLAAKGYGQFVSNAWRYPWRTRDGFTNNFYPKPDADQ